MSRATWVPLLFFTSAVLTSCGGGGGTRATLKSISINQQFATSFPKFTATGTYSDGRQVSSLAVSWIQWSYASFVSGQPQYRLEPSAFLPQCAGAGSAWTVVAIAPADPHAPSSGTIPTNVFEDLLSGTTTTEGGFVAATVQFTCP
jgi:hypothetical protein